jgi:hypothetical protein
MARVTIRKKGKRPLTFKKGGLHESLGVPQGQPIPPGKKAAALRGDYGPKAKKQANFGFRGALAKGRETVAAHAGKKLRKKKANPVPGAPITGTGAYEPQIDLGIADTSRRLRRKRGGASPTRHSATRMSDAQIDQRLQKGKMKFRY